MSEVVAMRCACYEPALVQAAVDETIERLGGWREFVVPGGRVLLKPNLIGPRPPEAAATTHPEVLRALIRSLKAYGCTVSVGDSAGGAIAGIAPTAQALKVAGWARVCEEEGAACLNFDRAGTVPVPSRTGRLVREFHIARPLAEADLVVNVPKLKVHSNGGYTGAVKNTFGCIPGLRKAEYHRLAPLLPDFAELIADIHLACRPALHVMDGIIGMEGAGPTNGTPKAAGFILGSRDSLALDTVAAQAIGLNPRQVEFLVAAARLGVGEGVPANITVTGDFAAPPHVPFTLPPSVAKPRRTPRWLLPAVIGFFKTQPEIDHQRCRRCGVCRESCPVQAISPDISIDRCQCIECLCCQELCPHNAVRLVRVNPVARLLLPMTKSLR